MLNPIAHNHNMLGRIVNYAYNKHVYNKNWFIFNRLIFNLKYEAQQLLVYKANVATYSW